ncbi:hypothetical protein FVF58_35490 [Paraburkholderia panacisoli]|uniref:Uncharacterized protein n=1 Tax=Paraburkholderia panacisoli TaxID=2603818 RepID=A0A5B0GKC1_9BURK|nr:hypothetical protein [Paraburkholderia panacisoli]KAA1003762.1 hypothetical protein FVF58_35490 [Paraburkholderia panacisoli]
MTRFPKAPDDARRVAHSKSVLIVVRPENFVLLSDESALTQYQGDNPSLAFLSASDVVFTYLTV